MGSFWGRGIGSKTVLGSPHIDYQLLFSEFCSISALSFSFEFLVVGGWWVVVVPSDYFVSTQLQLWLFCCWSCGCCWAVTIISNPYPKTLDDAKDMCYRLSGDLLTVPQTEEEEK